MQSQVILHHKAAPICWLLCADASVHEACREALLLLTTYLADASRPGLVDTVCTVLGSTLGQLEHMLRCARVSLWSWAAVGHMDALVQLYTELVQQVRLGYSILSMSSAGATSFSSLRAMCGKMLETSCSAV